MMLMGASSSMNEFKTRFKHVICDSHVKIVTLKQVGNVIWKHTYNINTKEWYFTNVINVLTDHLKKLKLKSTNWKLCIIMWEKRSHKCNNCSFSTASRGILKKHMVKHNSEKLSKCDQCSYEGNQKVALNMHVKSLQYDLSFTCEDCDYHLSEYKVMKIHMSYAGLQSL